MQSAEREVVARVERLKVHFSVDKKKARKGQQGGYLRAVDDVSLDVRKNEVLGLVGESGSGKSTCGRALLRLNEVSGGRVFFEEEELTTKSRREMRPLRREMQMIFQDPNSSLNPRIRVGDAIAEPLRINRIGTAAEQQARVEEMLDQVQLPREYLGRYPHQLSGGQKQRVSIARALITRPRLLVADEAVSALDVSVQAQILNLLSDLQQRLGLTILMISHDLSVVRYFSDRVAVMYLGRLMEVGPVDEVFARPAHPYTRALLDAIPVPDPSRVNIAQPIRGELPSPTAPPSGCVFRTRCAAAIPACAATVPELRHVSPDHQSACLLAPGEEQAR